jgi:hypothetical protein
MVVALFLGNQYCLRLSIVTADTLHKTAEDFDTSHICSSSLHYGIQLRTLLIFEQTLHRKPRALGAIHESQLVALFLPSVNVPLLPPHAQLATRVRGWPDVRGNNIPTIRSAQMTQLPVSCMSGVEYVKEVIAGLWTLIVADLSHR